MELKEKIKYSLRRNRYYRKYFQTSVNDMRYAIRHIHYYKRKYSWPKDRDVIGNTLYFIIDSDIKHPGLVDRLKAIIGLFYVAKQNGFEFKVVFKHPFKLEDYLIMNHYDWIADESDLSYSLQNTRLIAYNGSGKIPYLRKNIKQYHVYCYIGYDILSSNNVADSDTVWCSLFHELFRPSSSLQHNLDYYSCKYVDYVAVHLRFVNALEKFEGDQFNVLSEDKRENLIQRCLNGIKQIQEENPLKKVMVFSCDCFGWNNWSYIFYKTIFGGNNENFCRFLYDFKSMSSYQDIGTRDV